MSAEKRSSKKRASGRWRLVALAILMLVTAGSAGFYFWILKDLPDPAKITEHLNTPSVRVVDREGRLLYEILPENGGRHTTTPLHEIPPALRQATIATEDRYFYQNPGVDLTGILRAMWINLQGGETLAGGSTITQQVARNLLLEPEERSRRSVRRKLRETVLAWQITQRYSKDEVLALYLNQSYYGKLAYGVEAAAQTYFGRPVSSLDLAECALLAGLTQAPALDDPFNNLEAAKKRQSITLNLMEKQGYISTDQRDLALRETLNLAGNPYPMEAPHFVMMVRAQLDSLFSPQELRTSGGWTVRTTLNLDLQHLAESAVTNQLERLRTQTRDPFGHNVNNAALAALNPNNGEILALVGSPDYFDAAHAGAINMALAPRQPGSALKPLIYAAAFDPSQPAPWSPATMILDVTTHFTTHEEKPYTPVNYDGLEHGPVLVREALASSLNIPAVIALDHIGLPTLYSFAGRLGIQTLDDPHQADLSVALGGGEVRLLELTAAYGAFANGGYRVHPFSILEIRDGQGTVRYSHPQPPNERVLDERVAWLISNILSDDEARYLGFGRNSILRLDRPAAVKTGTTTNFHDNWTIGYTPSLVVGVWAGNTSHEAMRNVTGLTGAAPIWAQAMRSFLSGQPKETFTRPEGLIQVEVCTLSGLLPTPACPYRRTEWFIQGTQPREEDAIYRQVELDTLSGRAADADTPPERITSILVLDLPPQAENWAHNQGLELLSDLARGIPSPANREVALQLLAPAPNAIFYLSSKLPTGVQQLHLMAAGTADLTQVTLWVDKQTIAVLDEPPYEVWWPLAEGKHSAWAEGLLINGQWIKSERIAFEVR